jgi:Domain of unknown function (DUF4124)
MKAVIQQEVYMKKLLIFLIMLPLTVFAAIYEYNDPQGNLIFSDQPPKNKNQQSQRINNLPETSTFHMAKQSQKILTENVTPQTSLQAAITKSATEVSKENNNNAAKNLTAKQSTDINFTISTPVNDQNIWNEHEIQVNIVIDPPMSNENKIQILLDGAPYKQPASQLQFILANISRGEHVLQAQLLDPEGKIIKVSESIKFYLHLPTSTTPT